MDWSYPIGGWYVGSLRTWFALSGESMQMLLVALMASAIIGASLLVGVARDRTFHLVTPYLF